MTYLGAVTATLAEAARGKTWSAASTDVCSLLYMPKVFQFHSAKGKRLGRAYAGLLAGIET